MFSYNAKIIAVIVTVLSISACSSERSELGDQMGAEELIAAGDYETAVSILDQVIANEPNNADALTLRGVANLELENIDQAFADLQKANTLAPNDSDIMVNLVAALIANDQFAKSIEMLDRVLEENQTDADALRNRALANLKTNRFKEAISDYTLALAMYGGIDPVLYQERSECWLGLQNEHQANIDKTIAEMTLILDDDPDNTVALSKRALELYDIGEYELALYDLDAAIELGEQSDNLFIARGNCLYLFDLLEEAQANLDDAIRLNANSAAAYASRANLLNTQNKLDLAIRDYETALRIDPDYELAISELAWLFSTCADESTRNGARATMLAEKLVKLQQELSWENMEVIAACYAANAQFEKAIQYQQQAIKAAPDTQTQSLTASLQRYQSNQSYRATDS
jgi:tetratricopeptide (TPR) repeat protein